MRNERGQFTKGDDRERFWSMVEKTNSCWLWGGGKEPKMGYGVFAIDSHPYPAHRVSWVWANGSIPVGLCVCHDCDTPACVNPAHLFLGTSQQNTADRQAKGRQARGCRQGLAKLNEEIVSQARIEYAKGGITFARLAERHGVTTAAMHRAVIGRTWKHVRGEDDG